MHLSRSRITQLLTISALSFGLPAGAALACPSDDAACTQRSAGMQGKHARHADHVGQAAQDRCAGMPAAGGDPLARWQELKTQLQLDAQQQPLWDKFSEELRSAAESARVHMREAMQRHAAKPPNALERMDEMKAHMQQRLAAMEAPSEAFRRLYESLNPQQKALADQRAARMLHPMGAHSAHADHPGGPARGKHSPPPPPPAG